MDSFCSGLDFFSGWLVSRIRPEHSGEIYLLLGENLYLHPGGVRACSTKRHDTKRDKARHNLLHNTRRLVTSAQIAFSCDLMPKNITHTRRHNVLRLCVLYFYSGAPRLLLIRYS